MCPGISKYVRRAALSEKSRLGVSNRKIASEKRESRWVFGDIYPIVTIIMQHPMYWKQFSTLNEAAVSIQVLATLLITKLEFQVISFLSLNQPQEGNLFLKIYQINTKRLWF